MYYIILWITKNIHGLVKHCFTKYSISHIWYSINSTFSLFDTCHPSSLVFNHPQTLFKMPRHCKNTPDIFCYVCGSLITKAQLKSRRSTSCFLDALLGIKLRFMKQIESENSSSEGFKHVKAKFKKKITETKLKESVLVGLPVKELLKDNNFIKTLDETELNVWKSFKCICENFQRKSKFQRF